MRERKLYRYANGGMITVKSDDGEDLMYNIDTDEKSIEVNPATKQYLTDIVLVMNRDFRKLGEDKFIFWYDEMSDEDLKELEEVLQTNLTKYAKGGMFATGITSKKEIISQIKLLRDTIEAKNELNEELKSDNLSDYEIDLIENRKLPKLSEDEDYLYGNLKFLIKKYNYEHKDQLAIPKNLYDFMKTQGFEKGGETEDDTFVMLFKGYGFVEKRGSYGTRTFYNKEHNAYIYYDPKIRNISGYVGGGEGNDEVIPYSVVGVLDFFIEHDISESEATPLAKGGEVSNPYEEFLLANGFRKSLEVKKDKYTEYRKGRWYCSINKATKEIEVGKYDFDYSDADIKKYGGFREDDAPYYHSDRYTNSLTKFKKFLDNYYILDDKMAKGGKVKKKRAKFQDKVDSISDRLDGTKVPKRLRKDYGVRYDSDEANEAGRRIAGAQLRDYKNK